MEKSELKKVLRVVYGVALTFFIMGAVTILINMISLSQYKTNIPYQTAGLGESLLIKTHNLFTRNNNFCIASFCVILVALVADSLLNAIWKSGGKKRDVLIIAVCFAAAITLVIMTVLMATSLPEFISASKQAGGTSVNAYGFAVDAQSAIIIPMVAGGIIACVNMAYAVDKLTKFFKVPSKDRETSNIN